MSSKIKTEEDCGSGRDYLELARNNDWEVRKNGSYFEIERDGVMIRFPDSARPMPKETRTAINAALIKAGLALAVLASLALVLLWSI